MGLLPAAAIVRADCIRFRISSGGFRPKCRRVKDLADHPIRKPVRHIPTTLGVVAVVVGVLLAIVQFSKFGIRLALRVLHIDILGVIVAHLIFAVGFLNLYGLVDNVVRVQDLLDSMDLELRSAVVSPICEQLVLYLSLSLMVVVRIQKWHRKPFAVRRNIRELGTLAEEKPPCNSGGDHGKEADSSSVQ
jgi:hypothetical protein